MIMSSYKETRPVSEASAGLASAPDFLVIGHVTKDLRPDGSFTIGGAATYASLTAQRLGLRAGIVTSASPDLLERLPEALPGVAVVAVPADESTTFENIYSGGRRRQYLRGRAAPLTPADVPAAWRQPHIVLLGPLAQEVAPECASAFPGALRGACPQGWLRQWSADGLVSPAVWETAAQVLPHLHALVLSREDLRAHNGGTDNAQEQQIDALLHAWANTTPLLALTQGAKGATLYQAGKTRQFRAFPTTEVDPTGAGDVFAAAFLIQYAIGQDAAAATRYANCVASFVVEQPGTQGIPTSEQVATRLRRTKVGE
jgi:1D-myo-inositol 3-kinase